MELFGILPQGDLEELAGLTERLVQDNRNTNFVVIGASGFLGRWLSTFFTFLQVSGEAKGTVSHVVRDASKVSELEALSNSSVSRVIQIEKLDTNSFSHMTEDRVVVFFAATSTTSSTMNPLSSVSSTLLAEKVVSLLPQRDLTFIHLSSGGVYAPSARQLSSIPKGYKLQDQGADNYTREKIDLEMWSNKLGSQGRLIARNPRLFSFYGPGLQLDRHFAIGEFMARGKIKQDIQINGNPENLRSYLYPTDAIRQLLLQTYTGKPSYSQVGSSVSITIAETGIAIADLYGVNLEISSQHETGINHYVPQDIPKLKEVIFSQGLNRWRKWLNYMDLN
ncbi:NAD-dependent epimerase/dehydratase family protein [Candidatus Planktophila dulcis]|jgi:dTDP-glucose 4,6-dehydratase|uniref:NAD-dependent epimerase/dehydratase family protein n=1 Tax=Candidatus Planktophila dulcis TaxID=1884914 RepID=UPI003BEEF0F0